MMLPVIGLDATFLKGRHVGVLLTLSMVSTLNTYHVLAGGVFESESASSWVLFLTHCFKIYGNELRALEMDLCFISDRGKGLNSVLVSNVLKTLDVNVAHVHCVLHLLGNCLAFCRKQKLKVVKKQLLHMGLLGIANARTEGELQEYLGTCPFQNRYLHAFSSRATPTCSTRSGISMGKSSPASVPTSSASKVCLSFSYKANLRGITVCDLWSELVGYFKLDAPNMVAHLKDELKALKLESEGNCRAKLREEGPICCCGT